MASRPVPSPPVPARGRRSRAARLPNVDDQVLERARSGDAAAFQRLFREHRENVARLVYRMMGSSPDQEDVIQEVFLQVHRSLKDFRGQSRFSTWLYRVTVNVVLMYRRAQRSRPVLVEEVAAAPPVDVRVSPDEQAARRARVDAFRRLLDRLSEKKRTVFVLHELEGMAPTEISKVVDAPVLTVRTRLFYARRELEALLQEEPSLAPLASQLEEDRATAAAKRSAASTRKQKEEGA